ncbi:MAG: O-antigen ligase family protein [Burkholderiales bacterium]
MSSHVLVADRSGPHGLLQNFATAGTAGVALLFLTYWPTYSYLVLGGQSPLYFYMLPGFVALPLIFLQPAAAARLLNEAVLWWFAAYVVLGMAWLLLAQDFPNVAGQQWRMRVLACFFFCTILVSSSMSRRNFVALAIAACVVIAGALNWYDVIFPSRLVPVGFQGANPGRGAGLFINANGAAAFVLMGTIAALPYTPMRARGALLLLGVLAVAPTFSRFGWIFAVLLIPMAIILKLLDRRQVLLILLSIPLLLAGGGIYYEFMLQSGNENLIGRLAWFQTFGDQYDFSMRERAFVVQRAWESFLDSPIYGHGIGVTLAKGARVGTHNMYVLLMAEQGLIGLALYLSLIGIVAMKGWRLARTASAAHAREIGSTMVVYAAFLAAYGFVNHNVLDEPHGMFILAFIVAAGFQAAWPERRAQPNRN